MPHVESLEGRTFFSSTPAAVTLLLAQAKVIAVDNRAALVADAAGIRAVTAVLRSTKLSKPDAAELTALTKTNAADLKAVAKSLRTVNLAVVTDTKKLAAAGAALAKKPSNPKLQTQVATLKTKLSTDASAGISALTAADSKLAFDDNGSSSDLPGVVSSANQVFDGGFEVPSGGAGGAADGYPGSGALLFYASGADAYPAIPSSGATLDGAWHVAAGSIDLIGPSIWTAAEGTQSVDLDGISAGTFYQDVPTVAGHQYTLTFDLAGNPGPPEPKVLLVTAGAASQQFTFDATGKTFSALGWTPQRLSFTASAASTRVEFTSLDFASSIEGPTLDGVAVTDAATPSAQPNLSTAVTAYQSGLAASVEKLNGEAYTALTGDADNVNALYA